MRSVEKLWLPLLVHSQTAAESSVGGGSADASPDSPDHSGQGSPMVLKRASLLWADSGAASTIWTEREASFSTGSAEGISVA